MYKMLKGTLEKRVVDDQGTSNFQIDKVETKLLKDELELIRIFIEIFEGLHHF